MLRDTNQSYNYVDFDDIPTYTQKPQVPQLAIPHYSSIRVDTMQIYTTYGSQYLSNSFPGEVVINVTPPWHQDGMTFISVTYGVLYDLPTIVDNAIADKEHYRVKADELRIAGEDGRRVVSAHQKVLSVLKSL